MPDDCSCALKIAFIKSGGFSHTNASVQRVLEREFPGFELVSLDVRDPVRRPAGLVVRNLLCMLRTYGPRELVRRADPVDCFIQTPLCFRFIKARLKRMLSPSEYVFTFQTQTMWDAAVRVSRTLSIRTTPIGRINATLDWGARRACWARGGTGWRGRSIRTQRWSLR
jgi:hypothetical protein